MKIAPKAAESFIQKPDTTARAVLLYGPDGGLVRERAKKLITAFLGENYDPFALAELSEAQLGSDPALLADELSAIHMMAPKRVIYIRDAGEKSGRAIESAADAFNSSTLLIACGDDLKPKSNLRAWFEKVANAAAIACYHDEARDVMTVVREHLQKAYIQPEAGVLEYLCAQLGNDRYVTRQELEKISLYAAETKTLSLEEARALVDYNRETGFDDLTNAVADRNLKALETTLTRIVRDGGQPVAYIRALQRYFNRLYYIRTLMAQGQNAEMIVESLRPPVFFRQKPILIRHAVSWQLPAVIRALQLLVNAELACKSSDIPVVPASTRRLLQLTQIK